MKRCLFIAALALASVWATGCIIIDAEKVESRRPVAVRSDECVVSQSHAADTPAIEQNSPGSAAVAEQ
jgi:hypothetical protein